MKLRLPIQLALGLFLLAFSPVSSQPTEDISTGNFLVVSCQISIDASATNTYDGWRSGLCDGLVSGVMYASATVCEANGVTVGQAERVVEKYLQDHPEKLHLRSEVLVDEALTPAFPCKR